MPWSSRLFRAAGASALALAIVGLTSTAAVAADPPEGSYVSPARAWVDPTQPDIDGDHVVTVEYHFPLPTTHWVSHSRAPRYTDGVTHCIGTKMDFGIRMTCSATGDPVPGDYTIPLDIRSEGGDDFGFVANFTVCPETGCSDLFTLALEPEASAVCAGTDLAELGDIAYRFNVLWNASDARFGALPGVTVTSDFPTDGSTFALAGSLATPGDYELPLTVTDEFGGDHDSTLPITTLAAGEAGCPGLAATGLQSHETIGWMLALLATGTVLVIAAHRRTAGQRRAS